MFAIITSYNSEQILKENLLESLKNQTTDYELVLIDNTKKRFASAAKALNYGVTQIKSDSKYIIFAHQDTNLCSNTWLADAETILKSISDLGIAGVAGMSEQGTSNKERGRNIIEHGDPPVIWSWANAIREPERVQTLDECLIIIPRAVFNMLHFDEITCKDWHLYAIDYALSVRRLGFYAYVLPMFIYHRSIGGRKKGLEVLLSLGRYEKGYYRTLKKVLRKFKQSDNKIFTTCGEWSTSYPLILQRILVVMKEGINFVFKKAKFPKSKNDRKNPSE